MASGGQPATLSQALIDIDLTLADGDPPDTRGPSASSDFHYRLDLIIIDEESGASPRKYSFLSVGAKSQTLPSALLFRECKDSECQSYSEHPTFEVSGKFGNQSSKDLDLRIFSNHIYTRSEVALKAATLFGSVEGSRELSASRPDSSLLPVLEWLQEGEEQWVSEWLKLTHIETADRSFSKTTVTLSQMPKFNHPVFHGQYTSPSDFFSQDKRYFSRDIVFSGKHSWSRNATHTIETFDTRDNQATRDLRAELIG